MSTLLTDGGVRFAYHNTPLHCLPFITVQKALLSKFELRRPAFSDLHVRSTSKRADEERGFGEYAHLTLTKNPPRLAAKPNAGFHHIEIAVPASAVERAGFAIEDVTARTIEASVEDWFEFLSAYHEAVLGWVGGSVKIDG